MRVSNSVLSLVLGMLVLEPIAARQLQPHIRHQHASIARRSTIKLNPGLANGLAERQLPGSGAGGDDDDTTSVKGTSSTLATSTSRSVVVLTSSSVTPPRSTTSTSVSPVTTPVPAQQTATPAGGTTSTTPTSVANTQVSPTSSNVVSSVANTAGTVPAGISSAVTTGPAGTAVASSINTASTTPTGASSVPHSSFQATTRVSTNAQGSVIFVTEIETLAPSNTDQSTSFATVLETQSAGNSTASSSNDSSKSGGGLGTGAIVGISVVGGIIALGLILFVVWKLKQKRFASFDDDDVDGIKWPELNRHGESAMNLPLPAKPTGGHGFETNALERGRTDLDGNIIGGDDDDAYSSHYPVSNAHSIHDASPYYESPPLVSSSMMSYSETGVYGSSGPGGVTRNPSTGAATYLSDTSSSLDRNRSLGGTRAFDRSPDPEMMEMTDHARSGVSRTGSGRTR